MLAVAATVKCEIDFSLGKIIAIKVKGMQILSLNLMGFCAEQYASYS